MATQKVPSLDASGRVRQKHLPQHLDPTALAATIASVTGAVFVVSTTAPTETTRNGAPVIWIDSSVQGTSVTAAVPTFNDGTDTYTIPTTTGVDYKVGGVTKAAGSYAVTAPATVTVDAVAQSGYVLTGTTQWVGTFTVSTDTTAPTAPMNLAGTAGTTTMDLSWTASTDAVGVTGYRVSKDNGATWITSTVTGTSYQVTGLTAGTSYTFAVAARDAAGNWSTNATLTKSTTSATAPSGAYGPAVLADAPYFYLPLDDAAGSSTARQIGSQTTTTWTPTSVTFGATGIGDGTTAATFNGTSSVLTGPSSGLDGTAGTIEAIITPTSVSGSRDIAGVAGNTVLLNLEGGKVKGWTGSTAGQYLLGNTTLVAGTRYHVAMTYDGTNLNVYVNGALDGTLASTDTVAAYGIANKIGYGGVGYFQGSLAGVAMYKGKALTAARILAHAQAAGLA